MSKKPVIILMHNHHEVLDLMYLSILQSVSDLYCNIALDQENKIDLILMHSVHKDSTHFFTGVLASMV
jgi:hypothetical protein